MGADRLVLLDSLLLIATATGCALIGGLFFAFSTFVLQALDRLPAGHAIRAMQSINATVQNAWFFGAFFGTAVLCVICGARAVAGGPGGLLAATGAVLYLAGTILVTIVANVPLNLRLDAARPEDAEAPRAWAAYRTAWLRWNHLRTLASLAAAIALAYAR